MIIKNICMYAYFYLYKILNVFFNKKMGVMHFGLLTLDLNFTDLLQTQLRVYFIILYSFMHAFYVVPSLLLGKRKKQNRNKK